MQVRRIAVVGAAVMVAGLVPAAAASAHTTSCRPQVTVSISPSSKVVRADVTDNSCRREIEAAGDGGAVRGNMVKAKTGHSTARSSTKLSDWGFSQRWPVNGGESAWHFVRVGPAPHKIEAGIPARCHVSVHAHISFNISGYPNIEILKAGKNPCSLPFRARAECVLLEVLQFNWANGRATEHGRSIVNCSSVYAGVQAPGVVMVSWGFEIKAKSGPHKGKWGPYIKINGIPTPARPAVQLTSATRPACGIEFTGQTFTNGLGTPVAFAATIRKSTRCMPGNRRPLFRAKAHCSLGLLLPSVWVNGNSIRRPGQTSTAGCQQLGPTASMFRCGTQQATDPRHPNRFGRFHRFTRLPDC